MAVNPYAPPQVEIISAPRGKPIGPNLALRVRLGQIGNILQGVCAITFLLSAAWLFYGPPPFVEWVVSLPAKARGEYFYNEALWPINIAMLGGFLFCMLTLFIGVKRQKLVSLAMLLFFASPFILLLGKEMYDMVEVQLLHGR
ncbi:MAG: hypothetical protein ACR2FY_22300 [Pirellulaceae bacterium]